MLKKPISGVDYTEEETRSTSLIMENSPRRKPGTLTPSRSTTKKRDDPKNPGNDAGKKRTIVRRRPALHKHPLVLTVGHSTRSQRDFLALLKAHGVKRLVDVRSIPRSRHNPQFNRDRLAAALRRAGISYLHMKVLGGLRHARADSVNTAWRNTSFRGFADYMQTREFARGLRRLMKLTKSKQTAIMCAEAVPWRCHRSLIADALLARGCKAEEIASRSSTRTHRLTPWARVRGSRVTYPSVPPVATHDSTQRRPLRSRAS